MALSWTRGRCRVRAPLGPWEASTDALARWSRPLNPREESYCDYHCDMTRRKQRLTVTVDPELVAAGSRAVATGSADSLSSWVNAALAEQVRRDRKLEDLRAAITEYEAEFGEITAEEVVAQQRRDREQAVVVRGRSTPTRAVRPAGKKRPA